MRPKALIALVDILWEINDNTLWRKVCRNSVEQRTISIRQTVPRCHRSIDTVVHSDHTLVVVRQLLMHSLESIAKSLAVNQRLRWMPIPNIWVDPRCPFLLLPPYPDGGISYLCASCYRNWQGRHVPYFIHSVRILNFTKLAHHSATKHSKNERWVILRKDSRCLIRKLCISWNCTDIEAVLVNSVPS